MGLSLLGTGATLFLVEAWVKRKKKGSAWCRDRKIGPLREELESPAIETPDGVVLGGEAIRPQQMYDDTRRLLALHCSICPASDCRWHGSPP